MATGSAIGATAASGASTDASGEGTIRAGEFSHYYINFLTLFGDTRPVEEIEQIAHAAVRARDREIERFSRHLDELHRYFAARRSPGSGSAGAIPAPVLGGWNADTVEELRARHGGLLIALFHYGRHRQIVSDLAMLGIPYVAPVAKQAYFDCKRITAIAPPRVEQAMCLIEVEDPGVGRTLLRSLRRGRVGLIYVDGNMGPDGHRVEEGGVEIDFLGRRIRVKEGIARLAQSTKLPVLPILVVPDGATSRVVLGELLPPPERGEADGTGAAARVALISALYDALATQIQRDPVQWEFAFCLHRWMITPEPARAGPGAPIPAALLDAPEPTRLLSVSARRVALFHRDDEQFWIHVGRQVAFRLPPWADGLYDLLSGDSIPFEQAERWLVGRRGAPEDARALLRGLIERDLVALE